MKLKYYYYSYCLTKFILFCFQLGVVLLFLYWTFSYCRATWEVFTKPIFDMINNGTSYDYHSTLNWGMPILKELAYLVGYLILAYLIKYAVLHSPFSKNLIVKYFKTDEIDPIFANLITEYFLWHKNVSHEKFFEIYKEGIYQNAILSHHQKNKQFYQFITLFQSNTTRYKELQSLPKNSSSPKIEEASKDNIE